jgi:hypothetical protein
MKQLLVSQRNRFCWIQQPSSCRRFPPENNLTLPSGHSRALVQAPCHQFTRPIFRPQPLPKSGDTNLSCQRSFHFLGRFAFVVIHNCQSLTGYCRVHRAHWLCQRPGPRKSGPMYLIGNLGTKFCFYTEVRNYRKKPFEKICCDFARTRTIKKSGHEPPKKVI